MANPHLQKQFDVPASVDADQRRAADPNSSAWVAASAGTGKTKVLTDRVLRLLLAGSDPQEILCLTYTKAAAAEMENRLAARLSAWATLPLEAKDGGKSLMQELTQLGIENVRPRDIDRARTLFAAMLDCAGGMKIQTIHSFCQSLLARFPLEARLLPNFSVLDQRQTDDLIRQTFTQMLASAGNTTDHFYQGMTQALGRLLAVIGERSLRRLLTGDVVKLRDRLSVYDRPGFVTAVADALEIAPELQEGDIIARAIDAIPVATMSDLLEAALQGDGKADRDFAASAEAFLRLPDEDKPRSWPVYSRIFLTQKQEPRKTLLTKKVADKIPQLMELAQREQTRVLMVENMRRKARLLDLNRDFYTVARAWLDRLARVKRGHAALDFDDLITATRDLLNDRTRAAWVLYKLGYEIRHVLVDEAQDTSAAQWDIVARLVEEYFAGEGATRTGDKAGSHTLFVVGDEKQSIFSFNGADPESFLTERQNYARSAAAAHASWADVPLSLSFRSTGAVLDIVNDVFADEAVRQGVSAMPFTQSPARRQDAGLVEIWSPLLKDEKAAQDNDVWTLPTARQSQTTASIRLAKLIAARIARWIETGETLAAYNRPINAGDIMVLVPRRTAFFPQLVRALKERNILVAGVDRMIITEQLAVQDLLSLLNFLLLPEDDLNLATLLKTPLIALSEENLFTLCHGREDTVWQSLLEKQADPAFADIAAWLLHWRQRVDLLRPYELLQHVLDAACPADADGSARRALWQRLGPDALDPIDELLAEAQRFETQSLPTLEHFLGWLTTGDVERKRELAQVTGQVRIMTAHASKGLEAPIVFVVDLPSNKNETALLLDGTPPLFVPRKEFRDEVAEVRSQAFARAREEENRRLLYVALTRAEDRLYVCGAYGDKVPDRAWYNYVQPPLAARAVEVSPTAAELDLGLTQIWRYETEQKRFVPPATATKADETVQALPDWMHRPITPPNSGGLSRPLAPSRAAAPTLAVTSPAAAEAGQRFQRGNMTHKLLQYLPDWPADQRRDVAVAYLERMEAEVPADLRASVVDEVIAVLENAAYAYLFGPGSQAEVPLVGVVGHGAEAQAISGQVDRLLVTPTEIRLIDYKTNRPPPKTRDKLPQAYAVQMAYYVALLQQIYPDRPIRAALLWTDGATLMELPADYLAAFVPNGMISL